VTRLFASDLHLDEARPEITDQFLDLLTGAARDAQSLYLLGDLFEVWLGDDEPGALGERVIAGLAALSAAGVSLFVMQGNRDFLLGERFCERAGASLMTDPTIVTIGDERVLVTHGDALCTGDTAYQRLRSLVRNPDVQRAFQALPIDRRRALAEQARAGSRAHLAAADEYITDVSQDAVERALQAAGVNTLLHGHTHRPAVHRFRAGDQDCTRIVLGDWHRAGSVLRWDDEGYELMRMPRGGADSG
jgi:UDP-2,3-diacylglucosamine hydrolase